MHACVRRRRIVVQRCVGQRVPLQRLQAVRHCVRHQRRHREQPARPVRERHVRRPAELLRKRHPADLAGPAVLGHALLPRDGAAVARAPHLALAARHAVAAQLQAPVALAVHPPPGPRRRRRVRRQQEPWQHPGVRPALARQRRLRLRRDRRRRTPRLLALQQRLAHGLELCDRRRVHLAGHGAEGGGGAVEPAQLAGVAAAAVAEAAGHRRVRTTVPVPVVAVVGGVTVVLVGVVRRLAALRDGRGTHAGRDAGDLDVVDERAFDLVHLVADAAPDVLEAPANLVLHAVVRVQIRVGLVDIQLVERHPTASPLSPPPPPAHTPPSVLLPNEVQIL
eukprot:Rhum_TRINITY_DN14261_c34_g1::Rhum_TRINITY_DN14261_c34_g1_i1::g.77788::m.77788